MEERGLEERGMEERGMEESGMEESVVRRYELSCRNRMPVLSLIWSLSRAVKFW
jgi:hypothetical protein